MGLDVYSRREYKQGKFVYLLDDEEKTAWIAKGHIGRCRRYRLPDHVMVDGERYTVESVEIGAYNCPKTLQHLVILDSIRYVDEDVFFRLKNLRSLYIGKGVKYWSSWHFRFCPKLDSFNIDKDSPFLKYENGMVLSKDGKIVFACRIDRPQVVIPDGVEEISNVAFWYFNKLETIVFPKSLRRIGDNSFSNIPNLRCVVLPEGFEDCVVQSFMDDVNLTHIDLPSTFTDLGTETFVGCSNLKTIILRSSIVANGFRAFDEPTTTCCLYVPSELVEKYRQDPYWSMFPNILPIEQ